MPRRSPSPCSLLLHAALLWAVACGDSPAGDDPKVPFKLGTQPGEPPAQVTGSRVAPPPAQAAAYAPPIDRPALDGANLALSIVRATLLTDLDGDGDRDALALHDDDAKQLRLSVALRESAGFGEPRQVAGFAPGLASGCSVEGARIEALSATKARAVLETACGEPAQLGPVGHLFLSLEPAPRVYERLELAPRGPGGLLTLAVESADADGDGHDDVLLAFTLDSGQPPVEGEAPRALELALFDRPSGLVRDAREPETTLAAWASAALGQGAKAPDQAAGHAQEALAMRRALCREAGAPLVTVGGTPGFACGPGKSSTEAALALVLAHGKRGKVGEAFDAYRSLLRASPAPDAKALERARAALRALPSEAGVTLREGPQVEAFDTAPAHLPAARFVDEGTLFVRRRSPVLFAIEAGSETPTAEPADDLIRDPGGQLAVTGVERSCAGYALRIERRPTPSPGYVPAPPAALAPLLPLASPPGCTVLPESERRDQGGFQVLGWAPQGVVAARGAERFVVPLDMQGKPSGEPRALPADAPAPAPLAPGAALADGSLHVEATPFGVLLYQAQGVVLLRPDGYEAALPSPGDAAVSPSGRRVAVLSGGRVFLLTRAIPSTP